MPACDNLSDMNECFTTVRQTSYTFALKEIFDEDDVDNHCDYDNNADDAEYDDTIFIMKNY